MKMNMLAAAAFALALTACGGGGDKKEEKVAASGPVKREAGNWKTDVKLVKLDIPGVNDQVKSGMSKMMEGMSGIDSCLTQEQADKEDIAADMSKNAAQGSTCEFSKRDVSGGNVDVAGTCKTQQGQSLDMAMKGKMDAKKVDMTVTTKGPLPTGSGNMEMVMQITSTNTGACKTT